MCFLLEERHSIKSVKAADTTLNVKLLKFCMLKLIPMLTIEEATVPGSCRRQQNKCRYIRECTLSVLVL